MRFFILRAHYRSPLNYSDAHLDDAKSALARLYTALQGRAAGGDGRLERAARRRFKEAMDDDFNTPEAVAVLFDLAGRVNAGDQALAAQLRGLGGVLGILQRSTEAFFQGGLDAAAIEALIRRAGRCAQAPRLRRGRPDPQRAARARGRAGGRLQGNDLAPGVSH